MVSRAHHISVGRDVSFSSVPSSTMVWWCVCIFLFSIPLHMARRAKAVTAPAE